MLTTYSRDFRDSRLQNQACGKRLLCHCQHSLIKQASCSTWWFVPWCEPIVWQCCAETSASYYMCSPVLKVAWYNPLNILLAIPRNGKAEVVRWIPQPKKSNSLHMGHYTGKGQQQKPERSYSPSVKSCWGAICLLLCDTVVLTGDPWQACLWIAPGWTS